MICEILQSKRNLNERGYSLQSEMLVIRVSGFIGVNVEGLGLYLRRMNVDDNLCAF